MHVPTAQTLAVHAAPLATLRRAERRHGPVFAMPFGPAGRVVVVAEPDTAHAVLAGPAHTACTGTANHGMLPAVLAEGSIFFADGEENARRRELHAPMLDDTGGGYRATVAQATRRAIAAWHEGAPFTLLPSMRRITREAGLPLLVDSTDTWRRDALFEHAEAMLARGKTVTLLALANVLPFRTRAARAVNRHRDQLADLIVDELRHRQPTEAVAGDVLEGLQGQDRCVVRADLVSLLVALQDVQAVALTWAFERLARHPAVVARLRRDLHADRTGYLDAVVWEVLRDRPPVIGSFRILGHSLRIGRDCHLEAGTPVMVPIPLMQHNPESHREPHVFDPERFLETSSERRSWIPFGGGPRRCLGAHLAHITLATAISTVVREIDLSPARARPEQARLLGTMLLPGRLGRVRASPLVR